MGVVAGTGSIAASFKLVDGIPVELARIGGWGWVLGDEGSGFHVGKEAICQMLREYEHAVLDGKPLPSREPGDNSMRSQVLAQFDVETAPDLLSLVGAPDGVTAPPGENATPLSLLLSLPREKRLSRLAPIVFRAAFGDGSDDDGGDPLALSVLRVTSNALAEQISHLLGHGDSDSSVYVKADSSIIVFGGSLVSIPAYRNLVIDALRQRGHEFVGVEHVTDAAETGAQALVQRYTHAQ